MKPSPEDWAREHLEDVPFEPNSRGRGNGGAPAGGASVTTATLFDPWERYIVPEFPFGVLPGVLQDYVGSQSQVIGVDASAIAMAALTTISGSLDHRFAVKMMRGGK